MDLHPVRQLGRFLVVGTFNTAFSYFVYALLLSKGVSYPLANFASLICGILMSFAMQGHFVFRRFEARRFPAFLITWLCLWILNVGLISLLLPVVAGNAYLAGAVALCVIVPVSFVVQKHLVFGGGSGR